MPSIHLYSCEGPSLKKVLCEQERQLLSIFGLEGASVII